ncbi:MAG TPA: hypothetical protein VG168_00715, partial [Bryobacteraceae bacterium]|nr:hypothetical protein [Bryobacteraceae bacterium]
RAYKSRLKLEFARNICILKLSRNISVCAPGSPADYIGAVPENMQAAISQSLPIGSSQGDVQRFLSVRGIGHDRNSICSVNPNGIDMDCELGVDHHPWELVRETFDLLFTFDSSKKLNAIRVRSTFSSPW